MNTLAVAVFTLTLTALYLLLAEDPHQLLILLVLSTPLVKSVKLPYVGERIAIFELLFLVAALSVARTMVTENDWRLTVPYEAIPIAGLAAVSGLSLFNSLAPEEGILLVIVLVYYTLLLILFAHVVTSPEILRHLTHTYLLGSILAIIAGLLGVLSLLSGTSSPFVGDISNRVIGTFREPNQLPSFLLTAFPIFLLHPLRKRSPAHHGALILGAVLTFFVILGSGSDGAMVVIIVELIMVGAYKLYLGEITSRTVLPTVGVAVTGLVAFLAVFASPIALPPAVENSVSIFFRDSYALRDISHARYMQIVVAFPEAIRTHPVLGIGAGSFHEFMIVNFGSGNSLHNTYLGVLAESGIVGGTFLFIFLALIARKTVQIVTEPINEYWAMMGGGIVIGLLGLLIYGMAHYGLRQRQLWVLFGIIIALGNISEEGDKP